MGYLIRHLKPNPGLILVTQTACINTCFIISHITFKIWSTITKALWLRIHKEVHLSSLQSTQIIPVQLFSEEVFLFLWMPNHFYKLFGLKLVPYSYQLPASHCCILTDSGKNGVEENFRFLVTRPRIFQHLFLLRAIYMQTLFFYPAKEKSGVNLHY